MEAGPATASRDFVRPGQNLARRIESFRKPIIAAVNGLAFGGGCEVVEATHMVVASQAATFAKAEIQIGIIPVFGGTQRLPRHVGRKKALEMILTGDAISAAHAERLGLINAAVPAAALLDAAIDLARRVALMPEAAVAAALAAVSRGGNLPIDEGLLAETSAFESILTGANASVGVKRFLHRRGEARNTD
jgi:enoyl-CoA hydratase/carnithine racemase